MTQNEENKTAVSTFMSSKFGKVFATVVAILIVFAGPTYVIYFLKVGFLASFLVGLVILIIGLFFLTYLVQKKVIT